MKSMIRRLVESQDGATAIEYALIGVLIAVTLISGAGLIGNSIANDFNKAGNGFSSPSS